MSQTVRVLYLHQYFSTPKGAVGTRSYEMAQRLIDNGVSVTMVCGSTDLGTSGLTGDFVKGKRSGSVDGINVIELDTSFSNKHSIAYRIWNFIGFSLRLSRVVIQEKYDIAFATSTPLTIAIPALVARWVRRKPMVFEVRDLWPEMPRAMGIITNPLLLKAADFLEWAAYRSARMCIALSPGIEEGILAKGVAPHQVVQIPNGSDFALAQSAKDEAAKKILEQSDIPEDAFVAVFTGAHGVANGLDSLLDCAAVLQKRNRMDIWFLLVGDGSEKARLLDKAKAMKLDRVKFHNAVPKSDLLSLLKRADLGLMLLKNVPAFYRGTSPNKFFDYIACSLPVVVNYPGWMTELVEKNGCGFTCPPDDSNAFADTLILAAKSQKLGKMGEQGKNLAVREFDRDLLGMKFVDTIKQAAKSAE